MSTIERLFFFASQSSICETLQEGITNTTPLNCEINFINKSDLNVFKMDGAQKDSASIKIQNYVRLFLDPHVCFNSSGVNLESIVVVEINSNILKRLDVLKIERIATRTIEYWKCMFVDPAQINRVFVYSEAIKQKLMNAINQEVVIPIEVNSDLFLINVMVNESIPIDPCTSSSIPSQHLIRQSNILIKQEGDLMDSSMHCLVNTVNCVGIMGKGIALNFKRRFPEMFSDYQYRCKQREVKLGVPYCFDLPDGRKIVNFPTKHHWRENSKIEFIKLGLEYLALHIEEWGIHSMAIPPLGCGNGNLDWNDVRPLIINYLSSLSIPIEIYPPMIKNVKDFQKKSMDRILGKRSIKSEKN